MCALSLRVRAVCIVLFLGVSVTVYAQDDCGGIKNGTIHADKEWAHANRNTPASSESIHVWVQDWEDWDCPDCQSGNDWAPGQTTWTTIGAGGFCDPATGVSTNWKPSQYGKLKVRATLKDAAQWTNDSDRNVEQPVNAFEVKVIMNMVSNGVMGDFSTTEFLWEWMTNGADYSNTGSLLAEHTFWSGDKGNGDTQKPANVHIDYHYLAVPEDAVLNGGQIWATLATNSTGTMQVSVEDADLIDGAVTINLGATLGAYGVGFTIDTPCTFGNDCAEGVGFSSWGYSSTDGLGATHSPVNNNIKKKSCDEYDPALTSELCSWLAEDFPGRPNVSWFVYHTYTQPLSYSAVQTIGGPHGKEVQAQWDGYVRARTAGQESGKYAHGSLINWYVRGAINVVWFAR